MLPEGGCGMYVVFQNVGSWMHVVFRMHEVGCTLGAETTLVDARCSSECTKLDAGCSIVMLDESWDV